MPRWSRHVLNLGQVTVRRRASFSNSTVNNTFKSMSRPSLELGEPGKNVLAAKALQTRLESSNLQLVNKITELNTHRMDDDDEGSDSEGRSHKDPAIVAMEVADQIVRPQY